MCIYMHICSIFNIRNVDNYINDTLRQIKRSRNVQSKLTKIFVNPLSEFLESVFLPT